MNIRATVQQNKYQLYLTASIAVFLGLVFLYMYFLSMSVVHVVLRKEAVQEIQQLHSEIAMLETSYIDAQHLISSKIVSMHDFNETSEKIFIERSSPTLVLSQEMQ